MDLQRLLGVLCYCACSAAPPPLNVALHAQSHFGAHGWVAGSEVTTAGLKRALLARAEVGHVEIFAPYVYSDVHLRKWDLVLIEGWTQSVPSFIHDVRRGNPRAVVLQIVVDTRWMERVESLDVDGYVTNGRAMRERLARLAPVRLMQLAVDATSIRRVARVPELAHPVAYLGARSVSKQPELDAMLRAVTDAEPNLAIYGMYWEQSPDEAIRARWKGVLPLEDIAKLYSSVDVVLGMTEPEQRSSGMVNNRVFEALACGAALVTDYFPELESAFGEVPLYYRNASDAARHVRRLLDEPADRARRAAQGPPLVNTTHTWHQRVSTLLEFYGALRVPLRPNAPLMLVVAPPWSAQRHRAEARDGPPALDLSHMWRALLLLQGQRAFDVRPVESASEVGALLRATPTGSRPVVVHATRWCELDGNAPPDDGIPSEGADIARRVTRVLVMPGACRTRSSGFDVVLDFDRPAPTSAKEQAAEAQAIERSDAMHVSAGAGHSAMAIASALLTATGRAQYGGERSATAVTVMRPLPSTVLDASRGPARLVVSIATVGFESPEHGCWCIVVDGETVACEGDESREHTISLPHNGRVYPREAACTSEGVAVSVHADVRSHLRNYAVVRSSPSVVVRLKGLCEPAESSAIGIEEKEGS